MPSQLLPPGHGLEEFRGSPLKSLGPVSQQPAPLPKVFLKAGICLQYLVGRGWQERDELDENRDSQQVVLRRKREGCSTAKMVARIFAVPSVTQCSHFFFPVHYELGYNDD